MAGTVERTLALKLIGDVSDLKKPLAQADRQFGRLTKSALSWGKALGGALVIGGLERLVGSVGEGVKAFREEQDAVRNFQRSVKNMGMPLKAATKALDAMADRAVDLGFDDGDMIAGMDAFLKRTGDIAKATEMNNLAMDIARSRNISLAAAQKVVEGIYNGSARALKAYGIEGKKGMEAVEAARERERGKAAAWARNHPMEVMLGKVSDAWADLVGNLTTGDLRGVTKAAGAIGDAIMDALFGGAGKNGIRDSKTKGLVNQFGTVAAKLSESIAAIDWGKLLGDGLRAGLDALSRAGENGTLSTLAVLGGAIMAGLFAADLAVTALTTLFSVPKLMVKGVVSAIATVGASIAGTMFGAEKVTTAVGDTLATTIGKAQDSKGLRSKAIALGTAIGRWVGPIAAVLIIAEIGNELLDRFGWPGPGRAFGGGSTTRERIGQRLRDANRRGGPGGHRGWGSPGPGEQGRRTGFASGTDDAPRGWAWVGERGPELMRFRGGEQVVPNRRSMAMAGGGSTFNVNVYAGVGDPVEIGRVAVRAIQQYEKRAGSLWRK